MSLQVDYRPQTLEDIIGNKEVIESLKSVLARDAPPSTFLFTGPGGSGKTTLARIVAKILNVADADFTEQNASSERGIANIRELADNLKFSPLHGDKKFILLDEAHMLTKPSQEALLKTLEEPPSYVHIAICTTNPEALKQTFKRRCHQYDLDFLNYSQLMGLIKRTLKSEGIPIKKFSKDVAEKVVTVADGSAGQCMKLLDMVIDMKSKDQAIKTIESVGFGTGSIEVIDICRILCDAKINEKTRWKKIKDILKEFKTDGESARRPILGYLEKVLITSGSFVIAARMECFRNNYFDSGKAGLVLSCWKACNLLHNERLLLSELADDLLRD